MASAAVVWSASSRFHGIFKKCPFFRLYRSILPLQRLQKLDQCLLVRGAQSRPELMPLVAAALAGGVEAGADALGFRAVGDEADFGLVVDVVAAPKDLGAFGGGFEQVA